MKVRRAMHRSVRCCDPETTLVELAGIMRGDDIGAVPVTDKGRLVGIVTDRDITIRAVAQRRDPVTTTARDVMTTHVICCHEGDTMSDAIQLMEDREIRRLPVLDSRERLIGMLSLGDISHAVGQRRSGELIEAVSGHHEAALSGH